MISKLFICAFLFPVFTNAQYKDKVNVLSYYAVSNSIDGQPLIDKRNVLRFYPVFALQDSVTYVKVIVFHGNNVDVASAVKFLDGHYWESELPDFDIGEAIQRYEVEVGINYRLNIVDGLQIVKNQVDSESNSIILKFRILNENIKTAELKRKLTDINSLLNATSQTADSIRKKLDSLRISASKCCDKLDESISTLSIEVNKRLAKSTLALSTNSPKNYYDSLASIDSLIRIKLSEIRQVAVCCDQDSLLKISAETAREAQEGIARINVNYGNLTPLLTEIEGLRGRVNSIIAIQQQKFGELITSQLALNDSLKTSLQGVLTDKHFSGDGIQKSDIILTTNGAKLLYRNYRRENRSQVALDPAERLSIFRLRYVPFPVVGSRLEGPARNGSPVVFEIGVNFGNEVIASNEYVKPELSIKRLGLSVAVTPKLFSEEAEILALALTYEFNAYASVGAGFNFGTRSEGLRQPYFSFGINQKAFQRLLIGIASMFKG